MHKCRLKYRGRNTYTYFFVCEGCTKTRSVAIKRFWSLPNPQSEMILSESTRDSFRQWMDRYYGERGSVVSALVAR